MKILFLAAEVAPYAKTGGLGDVAKALPAALARMGHEVMVVMPRYGSVSTKTLQPLDVRVRLRFPFGEERAMLFAAPQEKGHEVIFLEHPGFYGREGLYGDAEGDYPDNHRRFAFFSMGALAAAQVLGFEPDLVHLNDWQTGLAAAALQRGWAGSALGRAKSVFTIHNLAYQGVFSKDVMEDLGLPWDIFNGDGLEFYDSVNFLKAGLAFSDAFTTVSKRYAEEVQTPDFGCNLDGFLRARARKLTGILNGVDYQEWNSANDAYLPAHFTSDALEGKATCKRVLREKFGLSRPGDRPLFGLVSRLATQKGIDILLEALPQLLDQELEVVLLGSGEARYERAFERLARAYPGKVAVRVGFDTALSHEIEAGSDFFLMPSLYEPCGLNQLYSLRYGTLPIVRATGGLDDTVIDAAQPNGNGFKFTHYLASSLLWAMRQAMQVYAQPEKRQAMQQRAMRLDFSWDLAAAQYVRLYQSP